MLNVPLSGAAKLKSAQITVNATPTLLIAARDSRRSLIIVTTGTAVVYIGSDNTVSTTNGHILPATANTSLSIPTKAEVWGIAASGTVVVSVMETYD